MFEYCSLDSEETVSVSRDELLKVVNDQDMITLKYESGLITSYYDTDTSFNKWIESCKGVIYETYNCRLITKLSYICSFEKAYALIKSPEWDGECYNFSDFIMADKNFCLKVIDSDFWSGNHSCFTLPMQDIDFCEQIIKSPRWNGDWYNTFTSYSIATGIFFDKVINCPKWSGNLRYLGKTVLNKISLCRKIVKSLKWDGRISAFGKIPRSDFYLCLDVIESPKWQGDCVFDYKIIQSKKFQRSLFKTKIYQEKLKDNELLHKLMLDSARWNGCINTFPENVRCNIDFCLKVIKHPSWNKNYIDFNAEVLCSDEFRVETSKNITPISIDNCQYFDVNFCTRLIESNKWSGNIHIFHKSVFHDKPFCITLVESGKWNGDTSIFPGNVMNDKEFCLTVIKSPDWRDSFTKFSQELRSDKEVLKVLEKASRFYR